MTEEHPNFDTTEQRFVASLFEQDLLPRNPACSPILAALLSLIVPGLGQVYIGQWYRGASLFFAALPFCFGLGLANVAYAYDAWSLARRIQEQPIGVDHSSKTLIALDVFLGALRWLGRQIASLCEGVILQIPLVNLVYMVLVKGYHR